MSPPTAYAPVKVEGELYERWVKDGYLTADAAPGREPFALVIPPPMIRMLTRLTEPGVGFAPTAVLPLTDAPVALDTSGVVRLAAQLDALPTAGS